MNEAYVGGCVCGVYGVCVCVMCTHPYLTTTACDNGNKQLLDLKAFLRQTIQGDGADGNWKCAQGVIQKHTTGKSLGMTGESPFEDFIY